MAGQLIPRGENTWLLRVFRGRDGNGKRKYLNKTLHGTKKQAQAELNKLLHQHDTGSLAEPSKQTLREYLRHWLEAAAKPRLRARTYRDYENIIRRYLDGDMANLRLHQVNPMIIQKLYSDLGEQELSARTIRYAHAVLHSALEQAVRWRLLQNNPAAAVELPRLRRREMTALSPDQAATFLAVARSRPADPKFVEKYGSDYREGDENRFLALWVLLVTTGLRPGEALAVRWSDLEGDRLRIQRALVKRSGVHTDGGHWHFEEPKTSRSRRVVALPRMTVQALAAHRRRQAEEKLAADPGTYLDRDLIFATEIGGPVDIKNLTTRHFKPLLKLAKLPEIRLYDLRHTHATLSLAAGDNPKIVSERLGHSTITLTMDTYSHVLPDMQAASAERMDQLLAGAVRAATG